MGIVGGSSASAVMLLSSHNQSSTSTTTKTATTTMDTYGYKQGFMCASLRADLSKQVSCGLPKDGISHPTKDQVDLCRLQCTQACDAKANCKAVGYNTYYNLCYFPFDDAGSIDAGESWPNDQCCQQAQCYGYYIKADLPHPNLIRHIDTYTCDTGKHSSGQACGNA